MAQPGDSNRRCCFNCDHHDPVVAADKTIKVICRHHYTLAFQAVPQQGGQVGFIAATLFAEMDGNARCADFKPQGPMIDMGAR